MSALQAHILHEVKFIRLFSFINELDEKLFRFLFAIPPHCPTKYLLF